MLGCGRLVSGCKNYDCSNPDCQHTKKVPLSCHSRFCPTCGKVATDRWVEQQKAILPDTDYQHITFTMPMELWELFSKNRELLQRIAKKASDTVMRIAKKRGINICVFTAIHTFGHDLKWNVHIHLSVTMGGLANNNKTWKKIRFSKKAIMPMWRYNIVTMLREAAKSGEIVISNKALDEQYKKSWIVHFSKPTSNAWHTISYLGRYLSRPPLSQSRLLHYDGKTVAFKFLNRQTNKYQTKTMDTEKFLNKFTQHIPDEGFRTIRYYGVLANCVRGKFLPIVYQLLEKIIPPVINIRWASLFKKSFGEDPLKCILCGSKMTFSGMTFGLKHREMLQHHKALATRQIIYT